MCFDPLDEARDAREDGGVVVGRDAPRDDADLQRRLVVPHEHERAARVAQRGVAHPRVGRLRADHHGGDEPVRARLLVLCAAVLQVQHLQRQLVQRRREIELLAARARRLLVAVAPPRRHRELVVPLGLLRVAARQRDQVGLAALAVDDARRGVGEVEERDVILLGVVVIVVVDRDALDADRVRALGVLVVGVRVAQLVAVHADVVVGPREVAAAAGAHGAVPDERVAAVVAEAMQRLLEAVRRRQHDVRRQQAAAAVERRLLQLRLRADRHLVRVLERARLVAADDKLAAVGPEVGLGVGKTGCNSSQRKQRHHTRGHACMRARDEPSQLPPHVTTVMCHMSGRCE